MLKTRVFAPFHAAEYSMRVAEKYSSENLTTTALSPYLIVSRKNIRDIVEVVIYHSNYIPRKCMYTTKLLQLSMKLASQSESFQNMPHDR